MAEKTAEQLAAEEAEAKRLEEEKAAEEKAAAEKAAAEKSSKGKTKVTFNKNVKYGSDRYKKGESVSVTKKEQEELKEAGVIE